MDQTAIWSYLQNERPDVFLGTANRLDSLLRIARKVIGSGNLLNIGAGNCYLEVQARRCGWNVVSVDPDEKTCARLLAQGIDARVGMVEKLPVESESMNVVVASEVLEHLTRDSFLAGLSEIKRVLAPQGAFIGTTPYQEDLAASTVVCPDCKKVFHRRGHQQSFTSDSMRFELSKYLTVDTCKPVTFPPWNILNWKGKLIALLQMVLTRCGVHGADESLLFVCRNS